MRKWIVIFIITAGLDHVLQAQDIYKTYRTFNPKQNNTVTDKPFQQLPGMTYDYYKHLGTACKAELHIEKATGIPLKFRVGSIEQSNYLEQKPNAGIYNP